VDVMVCVVVVAVAASSSSSSGRRMFTEDKDGFTMNVISATGYWWRLVPVVVVG